MAFIFQDDLRRYLEDVQRSSNLRPKDDLRVDVEQLRSHFMQRLREREESDPQWVRLTYGIWAPRLQEIATSIEATSRIGHDDQGASGQALATAILDVVLQCPSPGISLVTRLEAERIARELRRASPKLEEYTLETRLTRQNLLGHPAITELGRTFLRLRGKDAIRWLLTAEVLQSQGDYDDWRASRHLLEEALTHSIIPRTDWDGSEYFAFSKNTLDRLFSLGVLIPHSDESEGDASTLRHFVPDPMIDVIRAVIDAGPWHAAIAAILEDERGFAVPHSGPVAVEATVEQTRMFAHEVRNALGPVRYNIDELLSEDLDGPHRSRVEAAKKGVVRVLDFVDQMVSTSELITEPSTSFEVAPLLREVLGWIDGAEAVELDLPKHPVHVRGIRSRFLRALLDVVRNALGSATPPPPVRISAHRHDREVRITVDDGGPGVPPELRTRIFDDGFTTRPGGSGFGLAFLRQVVERELRGKVSCEEADLGGARFTISIPDPEPES